MNTPIPLNTQLTSVPQTFITSVPAFPELNWLQKHERLFLALIAGLALWFAIGKVDTLIARHDDANLKQAQVVAQVQQEKNEALAKQIATDKVQFDTLNAQVQTRDAQLVQLQATLVTALAKQQKNDATMTPTELTQRWDVLVPEAGAVVTPNGVTLPSVGARATVIELEKAPVLQQQLAASNEQLANAQKLVAAEGQQVSDRDVLIIGLQTKAGDDAKVCAAKIADARAEARKSKKRWFIAGYVAGFISRQVIKVYTGI